MTTANRKKPKVVVIDEYDGFVIVVNGKMFRFDQEDLRKDMVKVFKELGIDAEYEVAY